jgi:hypothetical protein
MKFLWSLETKAELMVLLSDKGYVTVVLDTADYNHHPPLGSGLQEDDQGSYLGHSMEDCPLHTLLFFRADLLKTLATGFKTSGFTGSQRRGKRISAAVSRHATIGTTWDVFCEVSAKQQYSWVFCVVGAEVI